MQFRNTAVALLLLCRGDAGRLRAPADPASPSSSLEAQVEMVRKNGAFSGGMLVLRETAPMQKAATKQPVGMQISEEELKTFSGQLSEGCANQFSNMLQGNGTGSHLHTFQDNAKEKSASEASCKKLDGSFCFTVAHLEEQVSQNGRKMVSAVDVKGNSCLPNKCVSESDLQAWSSFMHGKVMEQLPGQGTTMHLTVDCSASGGSTALVGGTKGVKVTTADGAAANKAAVGASKAAGEADEAADRAAEAASRAASTSTKAEAKAGEDVEPN